MVAILMLAIGLLVSILCVFMNGARWYGIGGLLVIVVVTGVIWGAHIPLM